MAVDLYWIPLGAGGRSVRFNGRVYEALIAAAQRRPRRDLYHAALVVTAGGERYTIEIAPSPDAHEAARGVVATGAVGSRWLRPSRLFRYEIRCWRGGVIPDLAFARGGRRRLSDDPIVAQRVLDAVAAAPTPVGPGRARYGGDVELELADLVVAGGGGPGDRRDPRSGGRSRAGMGRGARRRATPGRGVCRAARAGKGLHRGAARARGRG